jgi:hypothetical protein
MIIPNLRHQAASQINEPNESLVCQPDSIISMGDVGHVFGVSEFLRNQGRCWNVSHFVQDIRIGMAQQKYLCDFGDVVSNV